MSNATDAIRNRAAAMELLADPGFLDALAKAYQRVSMPKFVDRWGYIKPWRMLDEHERGEVRFAVTELAEEADRIFRTE